MAEGHEGEWVEGCGSHLCKRKMGMGTHGRGERSVSTERQGRRERQDSRERFQDAGKGLERGENKEQKKGKRKERGGGWEGKRNCRENGADSEGPKLGEVGERRNK